MATGTVDPDIDKVDSEDLIEIYAIFGLYGNEHTHQVKLDRLREEYDGDVLGAVYHLWSEGRLQHHVEDERVKLNSGEKHIAREMANKIYLETREVEELLEEGEAPDYLLEPETAEDFNSLTELKQSPDEEFYTRIIEILSGGRALKPHEVEDELATEINFELGPKLQYLETQDVVERRENDRYSLLTDNIDDRFFGENMNTGGLLQDRQRYGNDPWKP